MAMTLEELRRKAGTSEPGATVKPKAQTMTLDELRKKAGTTAPVQPTRVQPQISQPEQTAGDNSSAVSFEKPVAETVDVNKKYGLVDGKVVLPSHIENQGLYAAPGTEKSKVNYLMDSAAKGLAGGIVTAGEAVAQDLMGEGGKASREFYDYAMESAYNPQVAGQMDEYLKAKQDAEKNEKLRTDTLGYKLLESSDADMAKAQEGMGAVGQFMTGVVGSALQNAYLAPLAVINPGIASAMMALSAAGRTAKEKADEGNTLKQAMVRGAIDGTIEYFTEKLPMESLAKRLTGEGDDIVKFVLQQVASEAGEEGVSYAAGVMADVLSKNPDAQFSVQDLALNMLAGGMAGGLLAGGGIAVGATVNTLKTAQQPTVDATQTEANPVPKQPVGVKEYVDTLKESAKANAQNNLNGEYKKTGMTAAEYVEKNLDGNFYQENKLYFMEKNGTKVPVSKTVHDYAKYLQANRPQTATVNQTADAGNVAQITEPQNVQQTTPVQQASQTVEQQTVKDINVPGTNTVNNAPTETAQEETERIITTESNPARKALHRKKLVDMGKEGIAKYLDDFEKRTGIQVYLFDGSDYSWGFQKGKAIYLNIESPDIVLKTKVHESVHVYKKNNEKKFKFLRKNALKLEDYSRPNRFGRAAYDVRETYADDPDVDEEVVARLCELCLDDPEAFLDKVNRDKTIIEAVVDILKYIKNTLTTMLSKDGLKVEQAKIDNTLFALERLLRSDVGEINDSSTQMSRINYHAGDLGKAESKFNQDGGRHTGHFGTGTYFVSDKNEFRYGYAHRPVEEVDFDNYHLFRPSYEGAGLRLHTALSVVNNLNANLGNWIKLGRNRWEIDREYGDLLYDYESNETEENAERIDRFLLDNGIMTEERLEHEKSQRREYPLWYTYEEIQKDYFGKFGTINEKYDKARKAVWELEFTFDKSEEEILDRIAKAKAEVDNSKVDITKRDSYSTAFMKGLGYEGIDVSGMKGLDNTTYGSVIYDLKGKDLERKKEIGTAKYSKKTDERYLELAKNPEVNKAELQKMVEAAAREAGYNSPVLYHGTPSFGFTKYEDKSHKTPFIYSSTLPSVAAHYAGDNNYAFRRPIGKKYDGGPSLESIIQDAKFVLKSNFKKMSDNDRTDIINETYENAKVIADRLDELQTNNVQTDIGDDGNAVAWVENLFYSLAYGDEQYSLSASEGSKDFSRKAIADSVERYKENINKIREYRDAHRKEMNEDTRKYFGYLLGYDVGDAAIDIEYRFLKAISPDELLINESGNIADPVRLRENMDTIHKIGAYEWYGNVGNNPYVFDANGGQFFGMRNPDMGDGWYDTDSISKWALENGYTSVIMKNIYDYGDKADNYVFFDSSQVKSADTVTYDDAGNVIPLSERFKEDNKDIRFSKKGSDYLSLAQNPEVNEKQLQKMVDEAAKEAGYNYKAFHGTVAGDFTVFDSGKTSSVNDMGKGHYFTTNTKEAEKYAGKDGGNEDNEAKIEARIYEKWEELGYTEDDLYDNEYVDEYNRIYGEVVAEFEENSRVVPAYLKLENPYTINSVSDSYGIDSQQLMAKGYDGIIDNTVSQRFGSPEGTQHIIVFDSNQIKSADTVTYDNDGNIIPLEERFNTKNPDIRFSKKMVKKGDSIENTLASSYTNSRWIKEYGVATTREYEDFVSKVMSIKTGTHFEKTSDGLYIIPTGDEFGVNNTLIFTDGNTNNPSVEKVVHIYLDNETDIERIRDYIYGKETNKWSPEVDIAEDLYGKENFEEYTESDFNYIHSSSRRRARSTREKNTGDNRQQQNRTGNPDKNSETVKAKPYDDKKSVGIDGIKYSYKSARHDFIDDGQILNDLVNYEIFTPKQAEKFQKNIEKVLNTVLANPRALDMNEDYTKENRPYNSFKPNSDPLYKISLDFSTMCKKRLMTQYLIESLQTKLAEADPDTKAISAEETLAIRERLLQLKEEYKDIEVACGLCYVEAARLKGPKQINAFLDKAGREKMMRKYFAKQNEEFNKEIEDLKVWMKRQEGYGADVPISHLPQKLKNRINNTVKRRRERYTPSVEEQKIIDRALKMDNIQFLTVDNLTRMSVNEPEIYKAFTEQVRNSTRSKTVESGVPYYYGDSTAQKLTDKLIEAMNKENGLRHQSWSDFETVHLLDTITAICELSIRGAKMHAYTKVPNFIRLVGDTGMMINISLIPEGETGIENGKLVYSSVEGMDYETAKQLRDEHPATTGTICIGINDKQIVMMLNDGTIDYVIPYHASGMNKKLRGMAKVSGWSDYQSKQTEKYIAGATNKDNNPDWHRKPDFSEWFTPSEEDIANKDGVTIMREAAERYKQLCAERGLHPKFNDFVKEDNYWKLLIDRKMVDHKTGKIIIQDKVRPNFNFDVIDAILDEEVKKYDSDLKATLVDKLLESWNDGTIKAIENKLVANEKANTAKRNALAKNKLTAQDAMAVMSALGEGVVLDKDNIIDNSVYGKLLRFDAKMSRKSKRTAIPEEYIGKSVSEVKQLIADKHKAKSTTVNAVGATKANPKNITHMVNEYGEMKPGEKPERFISMPVSTDGNDRVGKFARTAAEAGVTSEKMVQAIEKAVARGDFSHEIWRDKTAIDDAVKYIEKYGYEATLKEFYKRVDNKGQVTKGDMTKALTMYAVAVENDNLETALKLAVKINKAAVNAGQVVQSVRILKKSSPEGRLYFAQKSLEAYQDEVNEKYGSKAPKLVVEDSILKALKDARTEEEIEKATTELHQVIADQLPFSWSNFITSWRYLAMLGNPRTQVRNVISNAVNSVASEYVNWIQAGIEKSTGAAKSTTAQKPTQAQLDYAEKDYKIIRKQLSGENKYKDNSLNSIERMKNPFSFPTFWGKEGDQFVGWKGNVRKYGEPLMKVLTKWNEATNYAMEKGDLIFSEKAYKKALARYLKANNIDPAKITAKQLTDARAWATRQALESVFRENNQLANRISRLERNLVNSNSKGGKVGAVVIGGLMPFKSTPLNITKRAFEYTPLGIIKGIADIKTNEKVYMPAAINDIAKGLSGTSLIILGAVLAKYGLLKGGLGDDKEDKMKKQMGQQSYSIDTPWFSYTLDWGGAALMPLFVGADIYESNSEDDTWLMNIVNALANAGSPIIETSMMTGMMDAIQSMSYEDVATEKLVAGLSSAMANYLGQFVPTLFGQVARAVDDTSRSSYTDVKGALKPLAKTKEKAQNKIPFLSKTNVPYMDVWGNEEKNFGGNVVGRLAYNMLSPGYVSTKSNDKVEKMLVDVYKATGDKGVLPSNYTTSTEKAGVTTRFTAKQYEDYTKVYGQTAYDLIAELYKDDLYNKRDYDEKASLIKKVYEAARLTAQSEVVNYKHDNSSTKRLNAIADGVPVSLVYASLALKSDMDTDNSNGTTGKEAEAYINKYAAHLTKPQKAQLYSIYAPTNKTNPYK